MPQCTKVHTNHLVPKQDGCAPQVEVDGRGGGHVGGVAVDGEGARIEDGEVRLAKGSQLLGRGPDEHVVHEQRVVRARTHHAHLDPRLRACGPRSIFSLGFEFQKVSQRCFALSSGHARA